MRSTFNEASTGRRWGMDCLLLAVVLLCTGGTSAQEVLPAPPTFFKGQTGLGADDSKSDFPRPVHAPMAAPNVMLVLLDDVGFGASSTFGGPCQTPTLDRLAGNGLRYTQFHTTALCSPTRAALLTGRNHHSVHTGVIMELGTGFPGYDTVMGRDTATVAEILKQKGWSSSFTTAAASGRGGPAPSASMANRWPKAALTVQCLSGSRSMKRSTWARIPAPL